MQTSFLPHLGLAGSCSMLQPSLSLGLAHSAVLSCLHLVLPWMSWVFGIPADIVLPKVHLSSSVLSQPFCIGTN